MTGKVSWDNDDKLRDVILDSNRLYREEDKYDNLYMALFDERMDVERLRQNGTITKEECDRRLEKLGELQRLYFNLRSDAGEQRVKMFENFGTDKERKGTRKGLLCGAIGGVVGGIAGTVAFALVKDTLKEALGKLLK
jgi:hypothetical protein